MHSFDLYRRFAAFCLWICAWGWVTHELMFPFVRPDLRARPRVVPSATLARFLLALLYGGFLILAGLVGPKLGGYLFLRVMELLAFGIAAWKVYGLASSPRRQWPRGSAAAFLVLAWLLAGRLLFPAWANPFD